MRNTQKFETMPPNEMALAVENKIVAVECSSENKIKRTGFMTGQISVPQDFDQMSQFDIEQLFGTCT